MKNEPYKTVSDIKMYEEGSKWQKAVIRTVLSGLAGFIKENGLDYIVGDE